MVDKGASGPRSEGICTAIVALESPLNSSALPEDPEILLARAPKGLDVDDKLSWMKSQGDIVGKLTWSRTMHCCRKEFVAKRVLEVEEELSVEGEVNVCCL